MPACVRMHFIYPVPIETVYCKFGANWFVTNNLKSADGQRREEKEASVCLSADICPSKSKQMCGEMRNSAFGVDVLDQRCRLSFDQIE